MSEEVKVTGAGTAADPIQYEVDAALCRAVRRGRWTTGMLDALADFALQHLPTSSPTPQPLDLDALAEKVRAMFTPAGRYHAAGEGVLEARTALDRLLALARRDGDSYNEGWNDGAAYFSPRIAALRARIEELEDLLEAAEMDVGERIHNAPCHCGHNAKQHVVILTCEDCYACIECDCTAYRPLTE